MGVRVSTERDPEFRDTITFYFMKRLGHPPNADQMAAYLIWCHAGATGEMIDAKLSLEPEAIAYAARPIPAPLPPPPHLEIRGNDFVDADGHPICHSAVDMFPALRMFHDNRIAELEALVVESHEFNFRWWRVFLTGSQAQNTIFSLSPSEPGYYDSLYAFPRWLNDRGIGLLGEAFVDNQDVKAGLDHWTRAGDCLRGTVSIISGGNEAAKNGFDPQALTDPGMIWSRGSGLADQVTPQNGASCASFHQRTDWPATLMDAVASEVYMEEHGYTVVMMDEPTRFDDASNKSGVPDSVRFAFVLGRIYGALWDLACFHNYCGARGIPLTPNLRVVVAAWQRGLAS